MKQIIRKANPFINFHDGVAYHVRTSLLICSANQLAGFYMLWTSVMKELKSILLKPDLSKYHSTNLCRLILIYLGYLIN